MNKPPEHTPELDGLRNLKNEMNAGQISFWNGVKLSETEKRVIINIHLRGCTGSMGSMTAKQRGELLQRLIDKGMLNSNGNPTPAGIYAAKPDYLKNL